MRVQFTKMHGLGNDFVVIDAVSQHVSLRSSHIQKLADRNTGIGFDQLLLVEPPSRPDADFDYRIFNSDGGEVEHCGNGGAGGKSDYLMVTAAKVAMAAQGSW